MPKAVFLDRDGVINKAAARHDYIKSWVEFEFLPGVADAIKLLNSAGYLVIVVTNQRGIARGLMSHDDVGDIHRRMCEHLNKNGAHIDGIYVCPHNDGECSCRKPGTGLFRKAEKDFIIDRSRSWMVGDSENDVAAGERYGVHTILTGDLPGAVRKIMEVELEWPS